ncbi:MAG: ABC transporter permease [Candidatus Thorarchaeota archaeon]
MKTRDVFSYSFSSIRLRKLRSGLTTLGIVIGIAAIVALLSFTQGFQVAITNQFSEGFATDTVTVSTQRFFMGPGGAEPSNFQLYVNDTDSIETLDLVESTSPVLVKQVDMNTTNFEITSSLTGIDFDAYLSIYPTTFVATSGEIPTSPDNQSVVIGQSIYDPYDNGTIFADVGDEILFSVTIREDSVYHVNNMSLTVVGILDEIGDSFSGPSDNGVYIPIDLATEFFETDEISSITVQLLDDSDTTIEAASIAIEELFDNEVSVTSATAMLETISSALGMVESLFLGIAGISLLVAGVGIMNIMIVSLMERTREIGILKALGAKGRAVLTVFLSEALIIGLLGGVIGIVTGGFIALLLSNMMSGGIGFGMGGGPGGGDPMGSLASFSPVVTPELIILALFFGVVVSVVFGLYPAWRASKLRPVDALRHE